MDKNRSSVKNFNKRMTIFRSAGLPALFKSPLGARSCSNGGNVAAAAPTKKKKNNIER